MSSVLTDGKLRTVPAIVSFPTLLEARAPNKKFPDDKKYSVTLIFKQGEGVENLKQAVQEIVESKWPKGTKRPKLKLPFRDGTDYEEKEGYDAGDIFVQFSRKESFGGPNERDEKGRLTGFLVIGPRKDAKTGRFAELSKKDIYPGMIGVAIVKPYYWHNEGAQIKDGISFGLEGFQKVRDGERLGGFEPTTEEEFEEFEPEVDENEASAGDLDDVPFETEE